MSTDKTPGPLADYVAPGEPVVVIDFTTSTVEDELEKTRAALLEAERRMTTLFEELNDSCRTYENGDGDGPKDVDSRDFGEWAAYKHARDMVNIRLREMR